MLEFNHGQHTFASRLVLWVSLISSVSITNHNNRNAPSDTSKVQLLKSASAHSPSSKQLLVTIGPSRNLSPPSLQETIAEAPWTVLGHRIPPLTSRGQNSVTMETKINLYCGINTVGNCFYVTSVHGGLTLCSIRLLQARKTDIFFCQCSSVWYMLGLIQF